MHGFLDLHVSKMILCLFSYMCLLNIFLSGMRSNFMHIYSYKKSGVPQFYMYIYAAAAIYLAHSVLIPLLHNIVVIVKSEVWVVSSPV